MAIQTSANPINIVAETIYGEARGESDYGKKAVATVIYNRCMIRYKQITADNLKKICLAKNQFSYWRSAQPIKNKVAYNDCLKLAKCMLLHSFKPLDNWTNYYAYRKCSPRWRYKLSNIRVIGNHKFGVLKYF